MHLRRFGKKAVVEERSAIEKSTATSGNNRAALSPEEMRKIPQPPPIRLMNVCYKEFINTRGNPAKMAEPCL
jgi:hypothetical protein